MNMLISCMKILKEMLKSIIDMIFASLPDRQRTVENLVGPWSAAAAT